MDPLKASKNSSQSSKSPKASLSSRVRQGITKRFEKSYAKKSSERADDTPSSAFPPSDAGLEPAARSNIPSSSREHSATDATVLSGMHSEVSISRHINVDMDKPSEISLWDKACANLRGRDENSKYVSQVNELHSFVELRKLYFLLISNWPRGVGCVIKKPRIYTYSQR